MKIERFYDAGEGNLREHTTAFETADQVAFKSAFQDALVAYEEWEKLKDDPARRNFDEKALVAFQAGTSLGSSEESATAIRSVKELVSKVTGKPVVESENAGYDPSALRDSFFHRKDD